MRSTILATLLFAAAGLSAQTMYVNPLIGADKAASGDGHAYINLQLPGGEPEKFLVDTGSVGLIVSAKKLGNPTGIPGSIRYSSSGIGYKGVWTKVRVELPDAQEINAKGQRSKPDKRIGAEIEVFAAQERTCDDNTPHSNCAEVLQKPITVHMLGIGYGRTAESATPERNLFLQLDGMGAGRVHRSFAFRQNKDLVFGLGFGGGRCKAAKLTPSTVHKGDWNIPPAKITIDGRPFDGTVLIDTGIEDALIAAEGMPGFGKLPPGTKVNVSFFGTGLEMPFTVGTTPMPNGAHWVKPSHGNYINTGYAPLLKYDYGFDADMGIVALCPRDGN